MLEKLSDENFVIFAAKHYDNPQCHTTSEFLDDLNRFKYLKKLFGRYMETGDLKERLVLNHLIVLFNCFDNETPCMLFLKMPEYSRQIKPFLVYLDRMPDKIEFDGGVIDSKMIGADDKIVGLLKEL